MEEMTCLRRQIESPTAIATTPPINSKFFVFYKPQKSVTYIVIALLLALSCVAVLYDILFQDLTAPPSSSPLMDWMDSGIADFAPTTESVTCLTLTRFKVSGAVTNSHSAAEPIPYL